MNDREKFEKEALAEFLEMTGIPKERIASYGRVSRVELLAYDETYDLKSPGLVVMLDTGSFGDRSPVVYFPKKSHDISEPVLSHSETSGLIYVYFGDEKYEITKYAIEAVKAIKALEQEPRKGHWIPVFQGDEVIDYRCSRCEFGNTFGKGTVGMNYCPRCGSRNEVKK